MDETNPMQIPSAIVINPKRIRLFGYERVTLLQQINASSVIRSIPIPTKTIHVF